MTVDLHATAADRLREAEQRYTASRRRIVRVLAEAGRPLTIAEVQAAGEGLPQSSVYRNLAVLEQAGVVRRVMAGDVARYEPAEDLTEHHHHLICTACGSVVDVTLPATIERRIDKAASDVADRTGFDPQAHRLDLIGRCVDCRD
ncbi:MAG TPA: Fur family transcriptional regulator [Acidimicrobiales bacterium]|nr:Fur family transcriptional regulator [Acidimicrobiales bacterium]